VKTWHCAYVANVGFSSNVAQFGQQVQFQSSPNQAPQIFTPPQQHGCQISLLASVINVLLKLIHFQFHFSFPIKFFQFIKNSK